MNEDSVLKHLEEITDSDEPDNDNEIEEEDFENLPPNFDMVSLISSDNVRIYLQRKVACLSPLLECTFNQSVSFKESRKSEYRFSDIQGDVLEEIVDYLHYLYRYRDQYDVPQFKIKYDIRTLVAADYLMI